MVVVVVAVVVIGPQVVEPLTFRILEDRHSRPTTDYETRSRNIEDLVIVAR